MTARSLSTIIALMAILPAGCTTGFGKTSAAISLKVNIQSGDRGAPKQRLPITFTETRRFTIDIEAIGEDGKRDTGLDSFVRLSTKPGTIVAVSGDGVRGRNVQLSGGEAKNVVVDISAAYGDTRIWAEDLGYEPGPVLQGKPRCADGIDNDSDGRIDFPADPGCAFADDDSENPGTFATGSSETLFFAYPRVADVRGVGQGGAATPFPKEQLLIDTGFDRAENKFFHSVVVTRIASDGFYVTDIDDPRGYSSLFAYTFNPPARLQVCDRLATFSGTSVDFFGFTELSFPAWSVEERTCSATTGECNRPCLVPEPRVLTLEDLDLLRTKLSVIASLVRVETAGDIEARITKHFGKDFATRDTTKSPSLYTFTEAASNCDFNENGRIEFTNPDEAECSNACEADGECTEWSGFAARSDFDIIIQRKSADGKAGAFEKIQANATSAPDFDVLQFRGKVLRAYAGTLRYFSGGSQFTIEARCQDDIVTDLSQNPKSSEEACVFPRLDTDNNAGTQ